LESLLDSQVEERVVFHGMRFSFLSQFELNFLRGMGEVLNELGMVILERAAYQLLDFVPRGHLFEGERWHLEDWGVVE